MSRNMSRPTEVFSTEPVLDNNGEIIDVGVIEKTRMLLNNFLRENSLNEDYKRSMEQGAFDQEILKLKCTNYYIEREAKILIQKNLDIRRQIIAQRFVQPDGLFLECMKLSTMEVIFPHKIQTLNGTNILQCDLNDFFKAFYMFFMEMGISEKVLNTHLNDTITAITEYLQNQGVLFFKNLVNSMKKRRTKKTELKKNFSEFAPSSIISPQISPVFQTSLLALDYNYKDPQDLNSAHEQTHDSNYAAGSLRSQVSVQQPVSVSSFHYPSTSGNQQVTYVQKNSSLPISTGSFTTNTNLSCHSEAKSNSQIKHMFSPSSLISTNSKNQSLTNSSHSQISLHQLHRDRNSYSNSLYSDSLFNSLELPSGPQSLFGSPSATTSLHSAPTANVESSPSYSQINKSTSSQLSRNSVSLHSSSAYSSSFASKCFSSIPTPVSSYSTSTTSNKRPPSTSTNTGFISSSLQCQPNQPKVAKSQSSSERYLLDDFV